MEKENDLKKLGDKFRLMRLRQGLSQVELADKIGKNQSSINRFENGNINPTYLYLLEICKGLNIPLLELIDKKVIEEIICRLN